MLALLFLILAALAFALAAFSDIGGVDLLALGLLLLTIAFIFQSPWVARRVRR